MVTRQPSNMNDETERPNKLLCNTAPTPPYVDDNCSHMRLCHTGTLLGSFPVQYQGGLNF